MEINDIAELEKPLDKPLRDLLVSDSRNRVRQFLLTESDNLERMASPEADKLNETIIALGVLLQRTDPWQAVINESIEACL
jgi:hypothetical protein